MSPYFPIKEAVEIIDRMLVALMTGMPSVGRAGSDLRKLVGKLHDEAEASITGGTVGTELQACFDAAVAAGAAVGNMDRVRQAALAEAPEYFFGQMTVSNTLIFSLAAQGRIIAATAFVSVTDADAMLQKMIAVIDTIKLAISDLLDGVNYQDMNSLGAAIIQHLVATERKLPRMVGYSLPASMPSLFIANMLYADALRSDELIAENNIVHPAFCPRDIVALSR